MVFRSFQTADIRAIRQQAFIVSGGTLVPQTMTTVSTGNYAYSELDVLRLDDGWLMSYVWPTTNIDKLTFRIKDDSAGAGGAFNNSLQTQVNGPTVWLRFSAALNLRTGKIRYVYH